MIWNVLTLNKRFLNLKTKNKLKAFDSGVGYLRVGVYIGNKKHKAVYIHRLLAQSFIPNPENKIEVNHIDGNTKNNAISNLEWVTNRENVIHAFKNNLIKIPKGENNATAKRVLQIDISTGEVIKKWGCLSYIKEQLNYNLSNISNACNGKIKTAYGFKWEYV